jgi:hypothetical protein
MAAWKSLSAESDEFKINKQVALCGGALLERLRVLHLSRKCLAFYETQKFITVFTIALRHTLSWISSYQIT